jgi:hypothetical protein
LNYQYGQFTPEHLQKIETGVKLFNEQKYWEAHEVLEDLWAEDTQDHARYIYWAIIQIAACCIHVREGNLLGAQGMIAKAKDKFQKAKTFNVLTPLLEKSLSWSTLEDKVLRIPTKPSLQDFKDLFDFRFDQYA